MKILDLAVSIYGDDFFSRKKRLNFSCFLHIIGNDFGARLSKSQSKQNSNLQDLVFNEICLHLCLDFTGLLFVQDLLGSGRVLRDIIDLTYHSFQWSQSVIVGVF